MHQSSAPFFQLSNEVWVNQIALLVGGIFPILSVPLYPTWPFCSQHIDVIHQSSAPFFQLSNEARVNQIAPVVPEILPILSVPPIPNPPILWSLSRRYVPV